MLKNLSEPFNKNTHYQKVVRFADDTLIDELAGYIEHINTHNGGLRLERKYCQASEAMKNAKTAIAFQAAASMFEAIGNYKDAIALAQECRDKEEALRNDAILAKARAKMTGEIISNYEEAIELLESTCGWKNANDLIELCRQKITSLRTAREAEILKRARQKELDKQNAVYSKKILRWWRLAEAIIAVIAASTSMVFYRPGVVEWISMLIVHLIFSACAILPTTLILTMKRRHKHWMRHFVIAIILAIGGCLLYIMVILSAFAYEPEGAAMLLCFAWAAVAHATSAVALVQRKKLG